MSQAKHPALTQHMQHKMDQAYKTIATALQRPGTVHQDELANAIQTMANLSQLAMKRNLTQGNTP